MSEPELKKKIVSAVGLRKEETREEIMAGKQGCCSWAGWAGMQGWAKPREYEKTREKKKKKKGIIFPKAPQDRRRGAPVRGCRKNNHRHLD